MIVVRGFAFLFFVLLAAAMMLWQANHLAHDLKSAWSFSGALTVTLFGLATLGGAL